MSVGFPTQNKTTTTTTTTTCFEQYISLPAKRRSKTCTRRPEAFFLVSFPSLLFQAVFTKRIFDDSSFKGCKKLENSRKLKSNRYCLKVWYLLDPLWGGSFGETCAIRAFWAQRLVFLFVVVRAHWFSWLGEKKKTILTVRSVFANFESVRRPLPGILALCSISHADVRRMWTKMVSPSHPLLLSSSQSPRRTMQIVKTSRKNAFYENHGDKKLDRMCGYMGRHVYFEDFVFFRTRA